MSALYQFMEVNMSNSLIMISSPNNSTVASGSTLAFTNILRRRGLVVSWLNNGVRLNRPGYYKISCNVTFTVPTVGLATITAQKNGEDIVGITASTSVATANTETANLSISGIVRVMCCEGQAVLTILNEGVDITTSNIELDVEYLG